ncbi:circadian clock protein LdpA [Chamaesiphon polymorphus]|uniref:4Fe-4S ferredoxin n=1 Tax=Chamaesiphon polymorphus CCALA 037 TaxID=2107692 RepID=A0A2T1GCM4_9CYAN|nr:LdpA C-terminal domain-containing domain [Chamaesiphon polymorphus]PSB55154.1 4Fe-4S ferredoxin [Chamaesiphon polymorphus CCALA 037]
MLYPSPLNSLTRGTWFKLICGASFGHLPAIRNLAIAYTLAGADCIDVAADLAVITAAKDGIHTARKLAQAHRDSGHPSGDEPWLMVSLNDGIDPHFRKAEFDPSQCPADCPRPCVRICPADAIAFTSTQQGVIDSQCYGCGRCLPICPLGLISTRDRTATPNSILPYLTAEDGIDAIEIHTQPGHLDDFRQLWSVLAPAAHHLKLLAISCPDSDELISYLRSIYGTIAATYDPHPLPFTLLWQTDGRPMSGDIGAGTTHAAIRLGEKVLAANLPGYVQLAGGTNHYTVPKLRERALLPPTNTKHVHGVAYGSYARVLLSPLLDKLDARTDNPGRLEAHSDLMAAAVTIANELVGQLKGASVHEF